MHHSQNFNKDPPSLFGSTLLAPLVSPASRGPLHYHAAVKLKEGEGGEAADLRDRIHAIENRYGHGWMGMGTKGEQDGETHSMDLRRAKLQDSGLFLDLRNFARH